MRLVHWLRSLTSRSPRGAARTRRPALEALEGRCVPTAGVLDTTFGGTGLVSTPLPNSESFDAAATYPIKGTANDGKVVAAGKSHAKTDDLLLVRYKADGTLDTAFGTNGVVTTDFALNKSGSDEEIRGIALQPDGKVVAVGATHFYTQGGFTSNYESFVARYNANGTPDTTFNKTGRVMLDLMAGYYSEGLNAVALQADGKIVAAGGYSKVVRLTSTGQVDASYSLNGWFYSIAITPSGQYVLGGYDGGAPDGRLHAAVWRYNNNMTPDTGFGTGGRFLRAFDPSYDDQVRQVAVLGDGSVVAAGTAAGDVLVLKLTPGGALDPAFNGTGYVIQNVTSSNYVNAYGVPTTAPSGDDGCGLAVQADGKIVVTAAADTVVSETMDGQVTKPWSAAIRFNPDGTLDAAYGGAGTGIALNDVVTSPGQYYLSHTIGAALQGDGRLVVAGVNKGAADAALYRLTSDLSPLIARGAAPASSALAPALLTAQQVPPILAEAESRWAAAGADPARLVSLGVVITDLPAGYLGMTDGKTVWLDRDADGFGWFVDTTPSDDSEFTTPGNQGERGRMDLLTVLMHEMGHALGLEHAAEGVMCETLEAGQRETPAPSSAPILSGPAARQTPSGSADAADKAFSTWGATDAAWLTQFLDQKNRS
jgi:uncharacterized delta-60 repeat protein